MPNATKAVSQSKSQMEQRSRMAMVTLRSFSFDGSEVSSNSFRPSSFTIGIVSGFFDSIDFRTKLLNYLGNLF